MTDAVRLFRDPSGASNHHNAHADSSSRRSPFDAVLVTITYDSKLSAVLSSTPMIECRPFHELQSEDLRWLKTRRHFPLVVRECSSRSSWGCIHVWNDEEIAPNAGFAMCAHANIEIITFVREGTVTHRDNLGNEGRIEAGNVQIVSAGTGIRHAEYNLEQTPARIFQIWITPTLPGGSPGWGAQPCPPAERSRCFVAIASGFEGDHDALPIRADARVLNAKMKAGESLDYVLREPRLDYLVPSSGAVDVNGVRIQARDGAAIKDVPIVRITAIEDAEIVMVDVP
jgi:quercetin 2,3-dioxygenase